MGKGKVGRGRNGKRAKWECYLGEMGKGEVGKGEMGRHRASGLATIPSGNKCTKSSGTTYTYVLDSKMETRQNDVPSSAVHPVKCLEHVEREVLLWMLQLTMEVLSRPTVHLLKQEIFYSSSRNTQFQTRAKT
jgi:hypothetical protein